MLNKINILGVNISAVNLDLACRTIEELVKARRKAYVCVAPVATLVDCQKDKAYKDVVNGADMVTPDGMPVVWLTKIYGGGSQVDRTYGPDLMRALCAQSGLRHYFFGSTPQVIDQLTQSLKKEFPGINIVGMVSPPFCSQAAKAGEKTITHINSAKPDIVWVGLGSPKQDLWMRLNRQDIDAPVLIGVGAAFDFLAGVKPQAPRWIQRSGFEWLFRLCCEPKRLWKRYLVGNSLFIFYLVKDLFKRPSLR